MQDTVNKDREKYIGGSDIPAIMGISPFKKRFELLQEKAGIKENTFTGNAFTEYGQNMEGTIREYISISNGTKYEEGKHFKILYKDGEAVDDIGVRIHTDGEAGNEILEIKTTSDVSDDVMGYKDYLVQLLFYMFWTEKPSGILAVYHRPEDMSLDLDVDRLQVFEVEMADYVELVDKIMAAVYRFVDDLHRLKENPFLTEEELMPAEIAVMANGMLALERKLAEYKAIQEEYERQKESLLNAMQAASVTTWNTEGGYIITAVEATADKTTVETVLNDKKVKELYPEVYEACTEEQIKFKKGRKAYLRITAPKGEK